MLILSGVPGSGKSYYAAHLEDKGWQWIETDTLGTKPISDDLEQRWRRVVTHGESAAAFADAVRQSGLSVVVEYGFWVEELPVIVALQQAGASTWFFTGDAIACLRAWREAHEMTPDHPWFTQVAAIASDWPRIAEVYSDHILTTRLHNDRLTSEEIDTLIKPVAT